MHPNLVDQLRTFLAVAETGTFSGAAERLGRAVSAVSYAVGNLEEAYGVKLFDRSGYKPQLTAEGEALLSDAEIVFRRLDRLNARVAAMTPERCGAGPPDWGAWSLSENLKMISDLFRFFGSCLRASVTHRKNRGPKLAAKRRKW